MKLHSAVSKSSISPAPFVVALLPLLLIGWVELTLAHPVHRPLSPPLKTETPTLLSKRCQDMYAQSSQTEEDSSSRLMPRVNTNQDHMKICCLHANILDFYLNNILHHRDNEHPRMEQLKTDLTRVSQDLQNHGCVSVLVCSSHSTQRAAEKMGGEQGIMKAMGEIDILFTYLQDFCVEPKNSTSANAL
uniref:Interleukin 22 n=1 Tax=Sphaeramia orbicularis TaxID=375764 RepID=A0A673A130_9TELE